MYRITILMFTVFLVSSWVQAQANNDNILESNQPTSWVSASYNLPQSFSVGVGARHLISENVGARLNIGITDNGAARFNLEATYYLDNVLALPPLFSGYATLGPTVLAANSVGLGMQATVGAEYSLKVIDFEAMALFTELSATTQFLPSTTFYVGGKLGVRVHF